MADDMEWESMMLGADEPSIDDEIKGMDEVSLSSRLYKSEEEIEKFTVNENLGDIDRTIWILRNGAPLQKLSVINSFGSVSMEYQDEFRTLVLPVLIDMVTSEQPAFQRSLGKFMVDYVSRGTLASKLVQLVVPISRKLVESRDQDVSDAWSDVFISCIKYIPVDTIVQQILPEALVDGGLAQPAPFRIWCGRVLGAVASRLDSKRIEDLFLKKAMGLCQDTDYEVRKSMCNQLNLIAKAVGPKLTKSDVIPEYMELLMDEETVVREAAITNIMNLIPSLDSDAKSSIMIPMWRKLCDEKSPSILHLILKHHGAFLWQTRSEQNDADRKFFLSFYLSMVASPDDRYRHMCAYNLPAMVMIYKPQNYESTKLDKVLDSLCTDTSEDVRRTLAQGFHEIVTRLGPNACRLTKDKLVKIISAQGTVALQAVLPNLETILKTYLTDDTTKTTQSNTQNSATQIDDIMTCIIQKERDFATTKSLNWRVHHDILSAYRVFPDYFDSDTVYDQCVPMLFKTLTENSPISIKTLVIRTLVIFMRKIKRVDHRESILKQLLDIREDRSYRNRILFFDVCEAILCVFSRKFFRDHVVHHYLGLARDPVANIRLRFVSMIPMVRRTVRVPMDSQILQKLVDATETLLSRDADRDVMLAIGRVFAKYGPLEGDGYSYKALATQSSAGNMNTPNSDNRSSATQSGTFGLGDTGDLAYAVMDTPASNTSSTTDTGTMLLFGTKNAPSSSTPSNLATPGAPSSPGQSSRHARRTSSNISLTDDYLFHRPDVYGMVPESIDRIREDEESKLFFEQMGSEWISKRREMHEARQELHRRFLDKEMGSGGNAGGSGSGGGGAGSSTTGAGAGGAGKRGGVGMSTKTRGAASSSAAAGASDVFGSGSGASGASGSSSSASGTSSSSKQVGSTVRKRGQGSSAVLSSSSSFSSRASSSSSSSSASGSFSISGALSNVSMSASLSNTTSIAGSGAAGMSGGLNSSGGSGSSMGGSNASAAGSAHDTISSMMSPPSSRNLHIMSPTSTKAALSSGSSASSRAGGSAGSTSSNVSSVDSRRLRPSARSGSTSLGNSGGANSFDGANASSSSATANGMIGNLSSGILMNNMSINSAGNTTNNATSSNRNTAMDDLRHLEQEFQNTPVASVNLSRVGMSTPVGISLPRVQQTKAASTSQTRPSSRPSGPEKVPELPSAAQMKKTYGRG